MTCEWAAGTKSRARQVACGGSRWALGTGLVQCAGIPSELSRMGEQMPGRIGERGTNKWAMLA
jgi:hypothetical protein